MLSWDVTQVMVEYRDIESFLLSIEHGKGVPKWRFRKKKQPPPPPPPPPTTTTQQQQQHHHFRLGRAIATKTQRLFRPAAGIAMGILGVDDLSGDAPLMEAGLDSLCLDSLDAWFLMAQNGLQIGWLVGWMVGQGGYIYMVLGHVWLFLWWFTIGGWELESLETKRSKKSKVLYSTHWKTRNTVPEWWSKAHNYNHQW